MTLPFEEMIHGWYVHPDGEISWHIAAWEKGKNYCTFYVHPGDPTTKIGFFEVDFFPTTMGRVKAEEEACLTARANAYSTMIKAQNHYYAIAQRLEELQAEKKNEVR